MSQWIHVAVLAACVGCISTLLLVFIWRFCNHHHQNKNTNHINFVESNNSISNHQFDDHDDHVHHDSNKNRGGSFYVSEMRRTRRPFFTWEDHPYLAADAVENGWSRFSFMSHHNMIPSSKSKSKSTLLGSCVVDHHGREKIEPEISFEICQGASEFMQKIRLNPGMKKIHNHHQNNNSFMSVASVISTALPLPGPSLGNYAFPQEAYFEITILYCSSFCCDDHKFFGKRGEGEKTKLLIQDGSDSNCGGKGCDLGNVGEGMVRIECKEGGKNGSVMFCLGLTCGGGDVPLRVPGSYHGSIGFNSNGSVFLDGMKLVFESEKADWLGTEKVIGCGFDPKQKNVFFTLDSELVHVIHCQSEEFSTPLCPILASNIDIMVLVNFGQSAFKYAPANSHRTPNPCFIAPIVSSTASALGYDDSNELFSMGRIDSQWHNRSTTKGNTFNLITNRAVEFDEESEADLFEIVLDDSAKSPNTMS